MVLIDLLEKRKFKLILFGIWFYIRVEFSVYGIVFECEGVKIYLFGNYVVIMEMFVDYRS